MANETTVNEWSPETGEVVAPPLSAGEKFSFFEDDEGESLCSGSVLLDGYKIRVRELSAAEMAIYVKRERALGELIQTLGSAKDEDAEALAEKIKAEQRSIWDAAIGWAVSGWELKRPDGTPVECTPQNKVKLRASKKAELCDKIVQRSAMGRDLTAFLDRS